MDKNTNGKIEAKGEIHFFESFWTRLSDVFARQRVILREPEPLGWYDVRKYDLGKTRHDEKITEFPGVGDTVFVLSISDGAIATIKFNSPGADAFALQTYERLRTPYSNLYLTNELQSGKSVKLLFARGKWDLRRHYPRGEIVDSDTVDSIHAAAVATANCLLALGSDAKFPDGVVRNINSGADASKAASPVAGDVYIATDTGKVYWCFTAGSWIDLVAVHAAIASAHHAKTTSSEISLANLAEKAHSSLSEVTANQHHTKFTTTEHDTTTRHPVSVIKTATGSATGTLGGSAEINIAMNRKSFFPQQTTGNSNAIPIGTFGMAADPNDYIGRFQMWNDNPGSIPYYIRWDYLSSSGPPVIWTITDKNGKIIHCWESADAPDPENPDLPLIEHKEGDGSGMPADWHSLKIEIPSDYEEIKKKAKEKKKSLSKHILDDYEVDIKTKKLKKRKMNNDILLEVVKP